MTTNDELDRAIDAVAHEMTNAEAPVALRARVLARIDESRQQGGFGMPRWAWAGALTLVIATAAGIWLSVPTVHQPQPDGAFATVTAPAGPPPAVESGAPPTITGIPSSTPQQVASTATRGTRARVRAQHVEPGLAWAAGPAPLPAPDPIAIDTLLPDALAIPGIDVAPLGEIQPITIPTASPGLPEPQRRDTP